MPPLLTYKSMRRSILIWNGAFVFIPSVIIRLNVSCFRTSLYIGSLLCRALRGRLKAMARTYTGLSGHYGAFELKAKYQRNMFLGTLFSVLFCAAIITGALLYQHLTAADMIIVQIDDDKGGKGQVTILPPPVNNPIKTKYEWASLRTSDLKIGIPVARPDEEFVEIEAVLPTRIEIEEHVDLAAGPAIEEYDGGFEFDKADDGYIPPPDSFISVEIPAQMIYAHEPEYPRLAKHAGIEAIVWVNALMDKEGKVREG